MVKFFLFLNSLIIFNVLSMLAADVSITYENMLDNFKQPATNKIQIIVHKMFILEEEYDPESEAGAFFSFSEVSSQGFSRAYFGFIHYSDFGLLANIGLGISSSSSYSFCGNLGIGFKAADHQLDIQADFDSQITIRGYYDYRISEKVSFGIFGRTGYGLGPRFSYHTSPRFTISWTGAYDWSKEMQTRIASVIQLTLKL